jgi:integrase
LVERLIRNETGTTPDFQTLIETTLARMGLLPAPSPPFEYVLDKYLEERLASGRKKKSFPLLNLIWRPAFSGRPFDSITPIEIQDTLRRVSMARHYSNSTRRAALLLLGALFNWARDMQLTTKTSPVIRKLLPRPNEGRTRYLSLEELQKILEYCPPPLRTIILADYETAFRLSELLLRRVRDCRQDSQGTGWEIVAQRTKRGKPHTVRIGEALLGLLDLKRDPDQYLFPGPRGGYALMYVRRRMPEAVKAAGLIWGNKHPEGITFHTIKHTAASRLRNRGIPDALIKDTIGWESRSMVDHYGHYEASALRMVTGVLDEDVAGLLSR